MKRFIKFALLLTLALGLAGCSGDGTLENGPEVTYEMAEPRLLDGERQEILREPCLTLRSEAAVLVRGQSSLASLT